MNNLTESTIQIDKALYELRKAYTSLLTEVANKHTPPTRVKELQALSGRIMANMASLQVLKVEIEFLDMNK